MAYMRTVGIRELQRHASAVLRDVKAGEVVEITERGRVIARVVPAPAATGLDRLIEQGLVRGDGRGFVESMKRMPPMAGRPGEMNLTDALMELRADER